MVNRELTNHRLHWMDLLSVSFLAMVLLLLVRL